MKKLIISAIVWLFVQTVSSGYSNESLVDRLRQHVYTLADDAMRGREAGSIYAQLAADYIVDHWQQIGVTPWNGEAFSMPFDHNNNVYDNIVGIIEGNHPVLKNEYIVVGAHYDHLGYRTDANGELIIFNGADDNASGTAVIIELARKLKNMQHSLGRTVVLVAFDAEEKGLHGSNYLASNSPFPIENVKLMLSVDMVGWYEASGYLKYMGSGTIKNGNELILNSELIPEGLNVRTKKFERSMFTATDTYGFARERRPTLAVTTGTKSPYHMPEDMAHLIDYEGMALVTQHLANLVQNVANDEDYHPSGRIAAKHRPQGKVSLSISAHYGSNYHHYTRGEVDGKTASSYGIGLSLRTNWSPFAISSEILYNHIEGRHPGGRINAQSVTVPLNLLLQTKPSEVSSLAVFVGPYYSYRFSGKQGKIDLNFKNDFYRDEIGLNFGLEVRISPICIGVTFRNAFTDFTRQRNADEAHLRNRAVFTTLSYKL